MAALAQFGRILDDQKIRPIITINRKIAQSFLTQSPATDTVTARMVQILNNYPHFFILRGPPPIEATDLTVQIARAIAGRAPHPFIRSSERLERVSQTRVEIDPNADLATGVTRYSRTHQALKLHTDSSYDPVPHELVAFQMVRPDFEGGHTIIAPVEDILDGLQESEIVSLHKTAIPFGRRSYPVLWRHRGADHIRFYDQQILNALRGGSGLGLSEKDALRPLLKVLKEYQRFQIFELAAGETLFVHNSRALHGRTAFAQDSKRLMFRVRMNAGCLA